jgi:nucleoside phosphorylase
MRILFVAADRMEYSGILARASNVKRPETPVDWARSAVLAGNDVMLVANGVGWRRAAEAVDRAAAFRPDAIVSTGFCGALDREMAAGDIVVGTAVWRDGLESYRVATQAPPGGTMAAKAGPILSIDHVAQTAEEKQQLRSSGACAVEMEAAGVAARAAKLGIPLYCIRSVTDLAGETMANNFNAALRPDGHFDTILILRRSLQHPVVRLPELVRLRNRCVLAAQALGAFFADCRF